MASSFWNGEFYWNGIHSSVYEVCIVDFDDNSILKQSILSHNIELSEEMSINGKKWFTETNRSAENIVIQLCKTNGSAWTNGDFINLNRWFFTKNFCKFQTLDYEDNALNVVYYLKAVRFSKFVNNSFYGYVEIEFQSYDAFAYVIPTTNYTIGNGETKNVISYSNLYIPYKPKLQVTNYGNTSTTISIRNTSTNKSALEIKGLTTNEIVTIDCQLGTVLNKNNQNRFEILQNYNFIEMQNGDNRINVTGNASVLVLCEFPVII